MEARDGEVTEPGRTTAYAAGPAVAAPGGAADERPTPSGNPDGSAAAEPGPSSTPAHEANDAEPAAKAVSTDEAVSTDDVAAGDTSDQAGATSANETSVAEGETVEATEAASAADRRSRADISGGIGCAALLLPLVAVAGAVLCFFAGVLSTASGCSTNGSELCSSNGTWYTFALPVFVSPLVAATTAITAVSVRRHRSTWLAVGYGIVFVSIIVGLATASTGSS